MLHCCNLSLTRVIVIIVLFQFKGKGLGEELVESADYPSKFGSFAFAEFSSDCCIIKTFLYDFVIIVLCAQGPAGFFRMWWYVNWLIDVSGYVSGRLWPTE